MAKRKVTVGLLWHSMNSDNLGIGALTIGHMRIVRDVCDRLGLEPHFLVLCWTDKREFYFEDPSIEVFQLRMKDFVRPVGGLFSALRRCDLVLDIGAGDSFADIYGPSRIIRMILAQNLALFSLRPLILSPQTIGPFSRWYIRMLALNVMNRAEAVATRDSLSTSFAKDMGYRKHLVEATDVALRLPFTKATEAGDRTKIGINVSGLLMGGGYTGDNMFDLKSDYPGLIRRVVQFFTDQENCEIHLIGHVLTVAGAGDSNLSDRLRVEDDYSAALVLAQEFKDVVIAPSFKDPSSAKSYIAGMDFMIGARMHACIAALSSCVPVLPMAYSRKFSGMFGTLGYDHIADCTSESADEIMAKIETAYANRASLKQEVTAAYERGLARLKTYEDLLQQCLSKVTR